MSESNQGRCQVFCKHHSGKGKQRDGHRAEHRRLCHLGTTGLDVLSQIHPLSHRPLAFGSDLQIRYPPYGL